jgi:hypothetical protein
MYKWTDTNGVIHYSDKPPTEAAVDLQTMDVPSFPASDPAKLAADQAALLAQTQAVQQLLQAQTAQQAQAKALAQQQARLDAEIAALQQPQSQPELQPIYITSAFVPRAYRANLYLPHRMPTAPHSARPLPDRPAISLLHKP